MKVLKFGGTSVGSVKSILSLKKIVDSSKRTGRYHGQTDIYLTNGPKG